MENVANEKVWVVSAIDLDEFDEDIWNIETYVFKNEETAKKKATELSETRRFRMVSACCEEVKGDGLR